MSMEQRATSLFDPAVEREPQVRSLLQLEVERQL
jgi:hypothetical protein